MDSSKEDIKTILELIKRFLPQFTATRDDLSKLNPSFVISFYKHYMNELANICQILLDYDFENVMDFCPHDVDEEMFLLLSTQRILKNIGVPYFSICDFYKPSNRTRTTMKICLNFLFYVKENLPTSKEIIETFNKQAKEVQLRNERVNAKKTKLSASTYRIGILKGELEKLNKQYEAETNIDISDIKNQLNKEVQQLENEQLRLLDHVSLQKQNLNHLNEQIQVLSDQVVSDDYELIMKSLQQLQDKIKEHVCLISETEKVLEKKQGELEHLNRLHMQVQKIDISPLDCMDKIKELEKKIHDGKSDESNINEQYTVFEKNNQNMVNIEKEFQEIENALNAREEMIKLLDQKISTEIAPQKELGLECQQVKEKYENSKAKMLNLEKEQRHLEEECKHYYQRLITCLNSVTTTFNGALADGLATYKNT